MISNFYQLSILLTNIVFSFESSNKKSRKVMKIVKFYCNLLVFGDFTDIFSNFATKFQILIR